MRGHAFQLLDPHVIAQMKTQRTETVPNPAASAFHHGSESGMDTKQTDEMNRERHTYTTVLAMYFFMPLGCSGCSCVFKHANGRGLGV